MLLGSCTPWWTGTEMGSLSQAPPRVSSVFSSLTVFMCQSSGGPWKSEQQLPKTLRSVLSLGHYPTGKSFNTASQGISVAKKVSIVLSILIQSFIFSCIHCGPAFNSLNVRKGLGLNTEEAIRSQVSTE